MDHPAAVPGAGRRAGRDHRPDQPEQFTTRHAYHHGYYDGFEREFRGFGMVEQWDTEELAVLEAGRVPGGFTNLDPATDLPPMLTRTWLHTGVFPDEIW